MLLKVSYWVIQEQQTYSMGSYDSQTSSNEKCDFVTFGKRGNIKNDNIHLILVAVLVSEAQLYF